MTEPKIIEASTEKVERKEPPPIRAYMVWRHCPEVASGDPWRPVGGWYRASEKANAIRRAKEVANLGHDVVVVEIGTPALPAPCSAVSEEELETEAFEAAIQASQETQSEW